MLTTALLWTLVGIGAWNTLGMAARMLDRAPWWPYAGSALIGAWAGVILWLR